jgi:hypothetical protein
MRKAYFSRGAGASFDGRIFTWAFVLIGARRWREKAGILASLGLRPMVIAER